MPLSRQNSKNCRPDPIASWSPSSANPVHDIDNVLGGAGATREAWDGAIDQMVSFGMIVTPEQRAMILEYLATYLGPDAWK